MGDGNTLAEAGGVGFLTGCQSLDDFHPGREVTLLLEEGSKCLQSPRRILGLQTMENEVVPKIIAEPHHGPRAGAVNRESQRL
jgi:hypothetical protein